MNDQQNFPMLRIDDIQYFPGHKCPTCGAAAATDRRGAWYTPFQDYFGSALRQWEANFGYVYFACECPHDPGPKGMRVARLGDALIPLAFGRDREACKVGLDTDVFNGQRVAQAVDFLANHADPARKSRQDPLRQTLYSVASGALGADEAYRRICTFINLGSPQDFASEITIQLENAQA